MPRIMVAQISDVHMPGTDDRPHPDSDPRGNFLAALRHANTRVSGILVTGDIAGVAGTDAEYDSFERSLDEAVVPVWLVPGNHDNSPKMQQRFNLPSRNGRCDYIVDLVGVRLVVLDTSRPGREDGVFDADQAAWLTMALDAERPALIAMHHPCIELGGPGLATIRLDHESIARLRSVVAGKCVHAVVSGHAHMTVFAEFAGTRAIICPSSAYEFGFDDGRFRYQLGEAQYLEHSWNADGTGFLTKVVTVAPELWRPIPMSD
ncbi:MAG: metallophosphoesterase [Acidobacteria bacterium]|nr:metallophosphoesterase [Acidobacteriota bacterium]